MGGQVNASIPGDGGAIASEMWAASIDAILDLDTGQVSKFPAQPVVVRRTVYRGSDLDRGNSRLPGEVWEIDLDVVFADRFESLGD